MSTRASLTLIVAAITLCAIAPGYARSANQASSSKTAGPPESARVDLNSANLDQLLKVPGLTRTWATRIIRFRPYRSKTDLVDRGVIPNEVYKRIKDYVIAHRAKL